jgi:hypothetical protein
LLLFFLLIYVLQSAAWDLKYLLEVSSVVPPSE